jgi:hypothetical protein
MVRDPITGGLLSVGHFDYVILQPWAMISDTAIATEATGLD